MKNLYKNSDISTIDASPGVSGVSKGLVIVGLVWLVRRLFGFPKGRITNKTIFPIGIARLSTSRSRFLLKLGFARCTGENSHF